MIALTERLAAVLRLYESRKNAAEVAGKSVDQLAAYQKGKSEPPFSVLARLAQDKGISLDWLATGEEPMRLSDRTAAELVGHVRPIRGGLTGPLTAQLTAGELGDFILIPRYDIEASAGPGAFADAEHVVDHMAFRADWLRRAIGVDPDHLVLITVVGDSMEPTIRSGDLLLIDTAVNEVRDDAIYAVVRGTSLVVKRVQRFFRGAVIIKGDNPAYAEETLDPAEVESLRVAGRVRWIARMI